MQPADLASLLFADDDESSPERAMAMARALGGQQSLGLLGLLSGDKVLGGAGQALLQGAQRQQGMLADVGQQRRQGKLSQLLAQRQAAAAKEAAATQHGYNLERDKLQGAQRWREFQAELGVRQADAKTKAEADAAKQRAAAAEGLRKEFTGNPVVKASQEVASAWGKIQKAAQTPSAAGDISLVYGFMKMMDPGSTVREGEFATAANAGSVDQRVVSLYNSVLNGQRLAPEIRADFLSKAKDVYAAQLERLAPLQKTYSGLAQKQGLDPSDVAIDLGFGGEAQASAGGLSPEEEERFKALEAKYGGRK